MAFGCMFIKTYRVYHIFIRANTGIVKSKVSYISINSHGAILTLLVSEARSKKSSMLKNAGTVRAINLPAVVGIPLKREFISNETSKTNP